MKTGAFPPMIRECLGCGYCCKKAPCLAAFEAYGMAATFEAVQDGTCPGLAHDGERYRCKLASLPGEAGEKYRRELHIGAGCCSPMNSDRRLQTSRVCGDWKPES